MREKLSEISGKIVWTGIVLVLVLRSLVEFLLFQYIDISDFAQIKQVETRANHIIEVIIFVSFILFALHLLIKKKSFKVSIYLDGALIGFVLLSLISFSYSINYANSLIAFLELFSLVCFFYMVSVLAQDNRVYKDFIVLLIIIAVGIALYGIRQYFFIFPYLESSGMLDGVKGLAISMISLKRVGSVFGWPNKLAGFLTVSIPVAIGLLAAIIVGNVNVKLSNIQKVKLSLLITALIVLFLSMYFTYSIGGWISLLIGLVIEVILIVNILGWKDVKQTILLRKKVSGVLLGCFFILLSLLVIGIVEKRTNKVTTYSVSARAEFAKWTVQITKEKPFLGVGIGNFKTAYGKLVPSGPNTTKHAHNSYLEIWSETGIGGLLIFLIFAFQLLRKGVDILNSDLFKGDKIVLAGLISGISAFLIHNVVEFTYYVHSVSLYWWFIVGLLAARIRSEFSF